MTKRELLTEIANLYTDELDEDQLQTYTELRLDVCELEDK